MKTPVLIIAAIVVAALAGALRDAVWRSDADPAAALARLARAVGGPEAAR
jgi:hypothetical protein